MPFVREQSGGTTDPLTISGTFISAFDAYLPYDFCKSYKYIKLSGEAVAYSLRNSSGNYVDVSSNTDYLISDYVYDNKVYFQFSMNTVVSYTRAYNLELHN